MALRLLSIASWLALVLTVGRVGILHAASFTMAQGVVPRAWDWPNVRLSLWYTLPVIGILAAHEGGHWGAARARGLRTSGPFALPLAPAWLSAVGIHGLPHIGVGGAFLWLRGRPGLLEALTTPAERRADMFDVAFWGLFWGATASLACLLVGAMLSVPYTGHAAPGRFWTPSVVRWLTPGLSWHPLVTASWVGWLLTSASLLPVWPLDGWRIVSAPLSVWRQRKWQAGAIAVLVIACWG